jgi:hypothetical protein
MLADATLGGRLRPELRPEARLGAAEADRADRVLKAD